MKIRVGLLGLGTAWESRHRPALRALVDRFEVRAVCDQITLRAEHAAREWNAACVDGFRALARRSDIDAVLMLAPQWYGVAPILAACDAGKAIYCAHTIDADPRVARQLRERISKAGVAFMAEFARRQAPATLRLKELIATRLGAPRLMFCHARVPAENPPGNQRGVLSTSQSHLMELIDWCRYVVGHEATSVVSIRHRAAVGDDDDYQMMSLDFSSPESGPGSGPVAQISCGRYMPAAWQEAVAFRPPAALQVACENGIAFVDLPNSLVWFDTAGRHQETLDMERPVGEQLLTQFYRAVTSLVHNSAGLEDAYRAQLIYLQARASHEDGERKFLTF